MAILSEADHRRVSDAVGRAEQRTSGEIVTVLAQRSDGYSDIALAWAALAAFTLLTLLAFVPHWPLDAYAALHGSWNAEWPDGEIFAMAAGIGILTFLAVWLIQLIGPVRFAMVPGRVKTARVEDRAITLFRVGAERRTHGRTGIMIYLSMDEHRAEIVADRSIAEQVADHVWGDAMAAMLVELKEGNIASGMVAAVERVGAVLAEHFPRAEDDVNELPDRLIEI
ncbi:TPM domain-containing protein [Pseudopontixanthobacter vadosimaris]|uniref:TPM domain-containing protein n=1 Tax=Pseudopontixanthobacter vadosimaris TaxID=2726450 RepID=UPI00147435F0|nr:TPM domain-containing protein [Pseudopontixanthobacter vadosimaris]